MNLVSYLMSSLVLILDLTTVFVAIRGSALSHILKMNLPWLLLLIRFELDIPAKNVF